MELKEEKNHIHLSHYYYYYLQHCLPLLYANTCGFIRNGSFTPPPCVQSVLLAGANEHFARGGE